MPLARINNRLLNFVHIPKTGGSGITDYMRRKGKVALYSREELEWSHTTPQHMAFDVRNILLPDGFADASFAIIRNPLERLLSEYRYRATRYCGESNKIGKISQNDKLTVELDWNKQFYGTFGEWVNVVFEKCLADPYACDNHIRPQVDFVGSNLNIFLFERGLEKVLEWIDLITDTKRLSASLDRNESNKIRIEVSDRDLERIREFYKCDYDLINSLKQSSADSQIIEQVNQNLDPIAVN
ncbi:sulfotransferase family 2 domain-containing protein [Sulfitobacter sp. MF3-043]|uniref:sulfotransferase family 2 domain-containing protein n=1 Tax=Sulfitobacter sediminivivens TaxID=3252902 RepID=UPI0036DEE410